MPQKRKTRETKLKEAKDRSKKPQRATLISKKIKKRTSLSSRFQGRDVEFPISKRTPEGIAKKRRRKTVKL